MPAFPARPPNYLGYLLRYDSKKNRFMLVFPYLL